MNLHCDLDLENNDLIFTQNTPAYDKVLSKIGCKVISSSADIVATVIFDQMSPHCDPELEGRKPIFLHDIWPMMLHYHTKFGYRRFSSRGDILQMNIYWNS